MALKRYYALLALVVLIAAVGVACTEPENTVLSTVAPDVAVASEPAASPERPAGTAPPSATPSGCQPTKCCANPVVCHPLAYHPNSTLS